VAVAVVEEAVDAVVDVDVAAIKRSSWSNNAVKIIY
jgi:hypothetical protein